MWLSEFYYYFFNEKNTAACLIGQIKCVLAELFLHIYIVFTFNK